jgi:hypothetical protein
MEAFPDDGLAAGRRARPTDGPPVPRRAYHATGDEDYYRAADAGRRRAVAVQHRSGGWNYMFDFAGEASLKRWYDTIGKNGWRLEEFQHYQATPPSTTPSPPTPCSSCCGSMSRSATRYRPALDKALASSSPANIRIGGWPQRYPRVEFSHHGKP